MIKIKHDVTQFTADVTLTPFGGDPEKVQVTYKFLPATAVKALSDSKTILELLQEMVLDISGLELPYNDAVLKDLLDWNPSMGVELMQGYWLGLTQAKAKN